MGRSLALVFFSARTVVIMIVMVGTEFSMLAVIGMLADVIMP